MRLDAIRDDWTTVLTQHLRGDQRIVAGDVVRADDRDNIGTVRHVDHDRDVALVHFVSPTGAQADVELPVDQLEVVIPHDPLWMATTDELRASVGDDPWAGRLVDYLDRINTVRAERAECLAAAAAGQPWTQLVDAEHLPDVAYYRDRWGIDDELAPLGPEPASQRSAQHRQWEQLTARIGPTGTLADLAALRARTNDPAALTTLDTAMTRRRDVVVADVPSEPSSRRDGPTRCSPGPPGPTQPGRSQREREVVAKVAVYRDRFDVQGDGLGAEPAGRDEQRIWRGLRDSLVALQRDDDRDDDRHLEAERDVGLER